MVAETDSLREKLRTLPKADLHVHFEGTVDIETLGDLARRNGVSLNQPVKLLGREATPISAGLEQGSFHLHRFSDFVALYLKITESIARREDIILIAEKYLESAAKQNVVYSEMYFTAATFAMLGRDMDDLFDGLLHAERHAEKRWGISIRWLFDMVRILPETGEKTISLACAARQRGVSVIGIGLGGEESREHTAIFAPLFSKARSLGFETTAHSGETSGPESMSQVLNLLQPSRIGHGIRAIEDSDLLETLRRQQVPLEVCPWSNLKLNLCQREFHPLRQMVEAGLSVVLASDDPGIFQKDLIENYLLARELGLSESQCIMLAKRSMDLALPKMAS